MARIKRLILDVLKPHQPNALDFAAALADLSSDLQIRLTVVSVDEKTESTIVNIEGDAINFKAISKRIMELGGSIHSIDEVEVIGQSTNKD